MKSLKQSTRKKAIALLNTIKEHGDQLTFDVTGNVFIDGDVLPNTNIYKLLINLFSGKNKEPGFIDFVRKLQAIGLSRFIPKKVIPKDNLYVDNPNQLHPFNVEKWYYLGP